MISNIWTIHKNGLQMSPRFLERRNTPRRSIAWSHQANVRAIWGCTALVFDSVVVEWPYRDWRLALIWH